MAQQTAVEWLYSHLFPKQLDGFSDEEWGKIDKAFGQAKQMEKEQTIKAFKFSLENACKFIEDDAAHYYYKTYKK